MPEVGIREGNRIVEANVVLDVETKERKEKHTRSFLSFYELQASFHSRRFERELDIPFFELSTEMQENTWARLRESSMHQVASHAT